jgi:hypothetical protein
MAIKRKERDKKKEEPKYKRNIKRNKINKVLFGFKSRFKSLRRRYTVKKLHCE